MTQFFGLPLLLRRLSYKTQNENLWLHILMLLKKRPYYGAELRTSIKETFGFLSGEVTAYRVLYYLNRNGFVGQQNGLKRKYYHITNKGENELAKAIELLKLLTSKMTRLSEYEVLH